MTFNFKQYVYDNHGTRVQNIKQSDSFKKEF